MSTQAQVGQPARARRTVVVLYYTQDRTTVFEYDLPSSLFAQFGDEPVTEVGRKLDSQLETALLKAVS